MTSTDRPSLEALRTALRAALDSVGITQAVSRIEHKPNAYADSHPSQVIACTLEDGSGLTLLCKQGPSRPDDPLDARNRLGLPRGLAYEANVYRHLLGSDPAVPRFYGSYDDPRTGTTWLFLEYLGKGWSLSYIRETSIVDAARMIGELHRRTAESSHAQRAQFLNRYDRGYFNAYLHATRTVAGRWRARLPSFSELLDRFEPACELLVSAPESLIHGEFCSTNIVWASERPYAVDWEEAAIGAGEIDLACLTEARGEELVALATGAYVQARWPDGPPHDFAATLEAARHYWLLRWIEDPDQVDSEEDMAWVTSRANEVLGSGGSDRRMPTS